MGKLIYLFEEGSASMKGLLGGKGANLCEMTRIGLPVPPGFVITTEVCKLYWEKGSGVIDEIWEDVRRYMGVLEERTGKRFGDPSNPLLVSVRSGAPVSMPGMMDTILNLGLNDDTVEGLASASGDERFAYDSYRRFVQMFGNVVMGIEHEAFEEVISRVKRELGVSQDVEVSAEGWRRVLGSYREVVRRHVGRDFPQDVWEQLRMAVEAVFKSWNNQRAITYRKIHRISDDLGTAVNVVAMVFGNMGFDSGTGVCFTRNPSTGQRELYGEFLENAQGEDVVAGIRTPRPISQLREVMPGVYEQLLRVAELLERHYRDMQDIEFTVERGKLYMLQTRSGKRSARAAVKIAVDMVEEGLISEREAVLRVTPEQVEQLLHRQIDPDAKYEVLAKGLPASPGAATGRVVFDADEAEALAHEKGWDVILVRPETTPDDIHGLYAAQGVLTSRGGMTSHAAVVARGMGKPCVAGCEAVEIDLKAELFKVGDVVVRKGDVITIDGTRGVVVLGEVPLVRPSFTEEFRKLLDWADRFARLKVFANADTPADAARAREFGARGIGLCRTEHMFMDVDRLPVMQEMIVASSREERVAALSRLKEMQRSDFYEILKVMEGLPTTIRLLDPPLHEFLPKEEELLKERERADEERRKRIDLLISKARALKEANPMLGFRGCRLGIVYPEIYEMQVEAIMEAACQLVKEGVDARPEIMMPLVGTEEEMRRLREMTVRVAEGVMERIGVKVPYKVGTMIEVPRAALVAGEIARWAEFFSFGTNDLTQTTFGYSRDDAEGKFLAEYVRQRVLPHNPFEVLDRSGVGRLMRIAVEEGRAARLELKVGICGEHGGNPSSIYFCHEIGLDYVSCSPYRVPVARLAAARIALGVGETAGD